MSRKVYEENIAYLLMAIKYCIEKRLFLPGLILLYSGIDVFAWLNRAESQQDVHQRDFEEFVNKYILPDSGIRCDSVDLYSARCGIVHSFTAESRKVRKGKAKRILYAWGKARAENFQELIDFSGNSSTITLHINKLYEAFLMAISRFNEDLRNNPKKAKIVYERADKFFINLPPLKKNKLLSAKEGK